MTSLPKIREQFEERWNKEPHFGSKESVFSFIESAVKDAYQEGFDAGGNTKGGTGRIMYENGLRDGEKKGREEAVEYMRNSYPSDKPLPVWEECLEAAHSEEKPTN